MFLVRTADLKALDRIAADLDVLEELEHVDLGDLNSLALAELHPASSSWISREPIVFDEDGGIAIFGFDDQGVLWLTQNAEQLAEFAVDPSLMRQFADSVAAGNVYAVDGF